MDGTSTRRLRVENKPERPERRSRPAEAEQRGWSWKHRGHVDREFLPRRMRDLDLKIARKVVVMAQLDAMLTRCNGDAAAERVEWRDEPAIDVDLCVAHVTRYIDDRCTRGDAIRCCARCARSEPAHHQEGASHGAPDSAASIRSPAIFTDTVVSAAGGFLT